MKQLIILILILCFGQNNFAQYIEKHNLSFKGSSYDAIIFKVDSFISKGFSILENNSGKTEAEIFESISVPFFAINAGATNPNCNLLGLYINDSQPFQPLNNNTGEGNFYMQPNGYIGFINADIEINSASKFNSSFPFITAVQNGPMLIVDNAININFKINSSNKNIRAGVGVFKNKNDKFLVFAVSNNPVTFYQFASFFLEKYKCNNALNLEGGVNCSMHLPSYKRSPSYNKTICKYLIIKP